MPRGKRRLRKKAGLVLLGVVLPYWILFPFLPFLDIPRKAILIPVAVVVGEALFLIAIALLGSEYRGRIKQRAASFLSPARRKPPPGRRD